MNVESTGSGGVVISLEKSEVVLLRYALERASFIDTPPDRQQEILRLADDLLAAIPAPPK
jgi:hypothetical protein